MSWRTIRPSLEIHNLHSIGLYGVCIASLAFCFISANDWGSFVWNVSWMVFGLIVNRNDSPLSLAQYSGQDSCLISTPLPCMPPRLLHVKKCQEPDNKCRRAVLSITELRRAHYLVDRQYKVLCVVSTSCSLLRLLGRSEVSPSWRCQILTLFLAS